MRIALLNQTFPPDVVSSAQHAGDLARALNALGHDVTVVASRRAYDSPSVRFPASETWHGVRVLRVSGSGLGKGARWRRAVDFGTLLSACCLRMLLLRRVDVIVAMTSPPLISFLAALFARVRGGRLVLWVMDLNPDEAIAAGWLRERSAASRVLGWCLAYSLQRAEQVIVLDRFMKERVEAKLARADRAAARAPHNVNVIAPWSHDSAVRYDPDGRQEFRRAHGLDGKFVVMYSGNHSPCHPLHTLLEAAGRLKARADIVFCFVGGGSEFASVKRFAADRGLTNIVCLPYQRLERLAASLSAADLHVVIMGDPFVGIVHPCKVYNILRLGVPFLYIGPRRSHVTDLLPGSGTDGWARLAGHGDVDGVLSQILQAAAASPSQHEAEIRISEQFSEEHLVKQLVQVIETAGGTGAPRKIEPSCGAEPHVANPGLHST